MPRRTVIVVSGHDEEAGGTGARAAAQWLQSTGRAGGVRPRRGPRGRRRPADRLATRRADRHRRKGLRDAQGDGAGHRRPFVGAAAGDRRRDAGARRARDHRRAVPARVRGPGRRHGARPRAARAARIVRMAVANEWLFRPLLVRQIGEHAGRGRVAAHDHRADDAARQSQGERAAAGRRRVDQLPHRAAGHRGRRSWSVHARRRAASTCGSSGKAARLRPVAGVVEHVRGVPAARGAGCRARQACPSRPRWSRDDRQPAHGGSRHGRLSLPADRRLARAISR